MLTFAKPKDQKKPKQPPVRIFKDGREVCNMLTVAGRDEYDRRIEAMRLRQGKRCCLEGHIPGCPGQLNKADATFEHQDGRGFGGSTKGGGGRDDRIEKLDPKTGKMKWINGAAHFACNAKKGSRRIQYNDAP